MEIYKFEPIYKERVWGGTGFSEKLNRVVPTNLNIGESWEIVDRNEDQSKVSAGKHKGMTLRQLITDHSEYLLGPRWRKGDPFPILVKWLDCAERLSLQVHPPQKIASEWGGEPKTENWYVFSATPQAGLFIGLKKGVDKKVFTQALNQNRAEEYCHRVSSEDGDSVLVRSGRIHAIDAGNLILEIQQNSDTTYRVFDWQRVGLDGKPRDLHIEQSLRCIDFSDHEPMPMKTHSEREFECLADSEYFKLLKYSSKGGITVGIKDKNDQCVIISVVKGEIQIGEETVGVGEQCISPFGEPCSIHSNCDSCFLVTKDFNEPAS